jgi:2-phosphosulfolactate phosphatase
MPTVHAYPLFSHASPESFRGRCVVVVDLLRAGTTITRALESGATDVRLFLEPQDAIAARELLTPARCVLGGERGGILIPGFDLDNYSWTLVSAVIGVYVADRSLLARGK